QQLLFIAKEALVQCPSAGRDPRQFPYLGGFGLIALMANDHLTPDLPLGTRSEDELLGFVATFTPMLEAMGRMADVRHTSARSAFMLSKLVETLRGRKEFVDIPALFEQATGLPLPVYQALSYGALSRYVILDAEKFREKPNEFFVERNRCFAASPFENNV